MEGIRRFRLLGNRIMLLSLAGAAAWALAWFLHFHFGLAELVVLIGYPLFIGGVVWVFAWVLEGFLQPAQKNGMS